MEKVDFIAVCARVPGGMICLNSALTHWDLSDEIPAEVHLAVPEGAHRPTPTRLAEFARALRVWRPMSNVMRVLEE